jgi:hypothetical protein
MMLEATALANAVSAYATILAGLMALMLTALMGRQPRRWLFAYLCVFITGLPTVWYHGFGETFVPGFFDIATNLLLGWALVNAVLGDYYHPRTRRWGVSGLAVLNLVALSTRLIQGPASTKIMLINLGVFGGFTLLEVTLILNSLLAVGLLYARRARIPPRARPLLYLLTVLFVIGALLATASNQRVDFHILAWHATWHIVGAFGFIALWAFNHMRFVMSKA